jgi:hypothetical protein
MSKPRLHLCDRGGEPLCGRTVWNRQTIITGADQVTCPQCKLIMERDQYDGRNETDPEEGEQAEPVAS